MNPNNLCRSTERMPSLAVLHVLCLLAACTLAWLLIGARSALAADAPVRDLDRVPFIVTGPVDSVHWLTNDQWIYVAGFGATGRKVQSPGLSFAVIRMTRDGMDATPSSLPDMSEPGDFFWKPQDTGDVGVWNFGIVARDGVRQSTNEYTLTANVVEQHPLIGFRIGSAEAPPGADVCIPLSIHNLAGPPTDPAREIGGFDLLLTYDAQVVTLTGLDLDGSILVPAAWEYLTYRIVSLNPAKLRIVAIADMNNGNQHPSEWAVDGLLANLCFRTAFDPPSDKGVSPVRFWWDDCGDNLVSSRDGTMLYIVTNPDDGVSWFGGDPDAQPPIPGGGIIEDSDSTQTQVATFEGGITGPLDHPCPSPNPGQPDPEPFLYFVNGVITIEWSPGESCDVGDLNLNGLAYEIADAVLYSNYFIMGPSIFQPGIPGEAQVAASDVNTDGIPLSVADLTYMVRVIQGLAEPAADCGPSGSLDSGWAEVGATIQATSALVTINASTSVGAASLILTYAGTEITGVDLESAAHDMDLLYRADSGILRVLIWDLQDADSVGSGVGDLVRVRTTGGGTVTLTDAEVSTFSGALMQTTITQPPSSPSVELTGNTPNPFNAQTSIGFSLDAASPYTLTIYNIAGQVVKTYAGQAEAGTQRITWDGRDNRNSPVASGVYFYVVRAGGLTATRRMLLLK